MRFAKPYDSKGIGKTYRKGEGERERKGVKGEKEENTKRIFILKRFK